MVSQMETEVIVSDSQSPSASMDHRFEVNGNLGCGEIGDTEPIDEEIVLDSSSVETPVRNLYDDTELVDDGNCGDEETLGQEYYGLVQVVDDSEDEDGRSGNVSTGKSTCLRDRTTKAVGIVLESGGSNDHECRIGKQESNCDTVTGVQGSSPITADSHGPGLDFLDSQEPGEATQADALGFVDQLLTEDLNFSPVNRPETSWERKSPPVSGSKGCQSLARRIKSRSPTRKMSVFDWVSDECDVNDPQDSPVICANSSCFKRRKYHVADDGPGEKKASTDPCDNRKVSTDATQKSMQNSSAKHSKMEQAWGLSPSITSISLKDAQWQDKASKEHLEPEEDFIDIGINTQIAAEAMSALVYTPCTNEVACESDAISGRLSDQVSNLSRQNNAIMECGPEREKRSGCLSSAPHKDNKSKKKRKFTKEGRSGTKVSVIPSLVSLCEWRHPRAKRSRLMQRHHVPPKISWGAGSVKDRSKTNILPSMLQVSSSRTRQATSCHSGLIDVANHASARKIYEGSHISPCNEDLSRLSCQNEFAIRFGGSGKDLRRRRNLAHIRVLFSQNLDDETVKQQKKIMTRLGISQASSSADSTHFIADRYARTRNMLEAIALGKPVVTPLWLESCGETRFWMDEKSYILRDNKKEKEGFSMLTSLTRAKHHPLLKGFEVCITPNIKPSRDMIADLVKITQGQVVEISEIIEADNRTFPDDLLILSCEDDRDVCLPFIKQGAKIYTSELLLNGIVIQKLEYARHGLFSEKRNQRKT